MGVARVTTTCEDNREYEVKSKREDQMEEEEDGLGGEGSHHAGLEWEGILRSCYQEGGQLTIPKDWIALSRTCKSCNKMVAEFIKQNKRLVFPPDSGSAQIFKLLTRDSVNLRVAGFPFCTWLTDALLQPVVEQNLLLERLDISGCNSLTDTLLLRVSVCLTRLTHLTLSHCPWVSGASIDFLAFHHSKR